MSASRLVSKSATCSPTTQALLDLLEGKLARRRSLNDSYPTRMPIYSVSFVFRHVEAIIAALHSLLGAETLVQLQAENIHQLEAEVARLTATLGANHD